MDAEPRQNKGHLLVESILASCLVGLLAIWAIRNPGKLCPRCLSHLRPPSPEDETIAPFGASLFCRHEGIRYHESVEDGTSVLRIRRHIRPDVEKPPPLGWIEKDRWKGITPRPLFRIRETEQALYVSMTMDTQARETGSAQLIGRRLLVSCDGRPSVPGSNEIGATLLLPGDGKWLPPARATRTNGVLVIRIAREGVAGKE